MPAAARHEAGRRRWWALAVLLTATFLSVADVFIAAIAAPAIRADLGASEGQIQLVLAAYNLSYGAGLIAGGRLGDRYGRRRLFSIGLSVFCGASALNGLATSPEVLVAGRLIQGIGPALMIPQVIAIIQEDFTASARGTAFGAFAAVSGLAAAIAQPLGGLLIEVDLLGLGWRAIFLVNLPVGVVAAALARWYVGESRADRPERLDVGGLVLVTATLGSLVTALVLGPEIGWGRWSGTALITAVVAAGCGVAWERRVRAGGGVPLIRPELFRVRGFSRAVSGAALFYASNAVLFVLLPLHLQSARGIGAATAGAVFATLAITFAVVSSFAGKLAAVRGPRVLRWGSTVLVLGYLGCAVIAMVGDLALPLLITVLVVIGAGMGLVNSPLHVVATDAVPRPLVGAASGVLATALELGYGFGIILGTTVYFGVVDLTGGTWHGGAATTAFASTILVPGLLSAVVGALMGNVARLSGAGASDDQVPTGVS